MGQVQNTTGAALNTASNTAGVTNFLRPEDGAWDPANPADFYFATTNSFTAPSRLWRLRFTDINNPELGGTITAVLDGTEGPKMIDNIGMDNFGNIMLQEDVGSQAHLGKIWQYNTATDALKLIAQHDANRFITGAPGFLTQDEEASGIIDMQSILGAGMFLMVDQAHYALPGELVEGGQLLSLYNPDTYNANPEVNILGNNLNILNNDVTPSTADNTDYGTIMKDNTLNKTFVIQNNGVGSLIVKGISLTGANSAEFKLINPPTFPLTINSNNVYSFEVQFAPTNLGVRNAKVSIITNDVDENTYTYNVVGNASQNTKLNAAMKLASAIQLYPNPANNETNIVLNLLSKENVNIKMIDIQGKEIYTNSQLLEQGSNTLKLNTADLKSGIYFIEVAINNNLTRIKVAVSH